MTVFKLSIQTYIHAVRCNIKEVRPKSNLHLNLNGGLDLNNILVQIIDIDKNNQSGGKWLEDLPLTW